MYMLMYTAIDITIKMTLLYWSTGRYNILLQFAQQVLYMNIMMRIIKMYDVNYCMDLIITRSKNLIFQST